MLFFFSSQTRIYDANWKITNFHSVLLKHILLLKHKLFSAILKTPPIWNTPTSPCDIWQNRRWLDSPHRAPLSTPDRTNPACESVAGWWWWGPRGWDGHLLCRVEGRTRRLHPPARVCVPHRSAWGGAKERPQAWGPWSLAEGLSNTRGQSLRTFRFQAAA